VDHRQCPLPTIFYPGAAILSWDLPRSPLPYQNRLNLRPALLVGFFLGGLVIHGGLQGWWIEPVLGNLDEVPLMLGSTILTAFNDNAAITFLSTLVPDFSDADEIRRGCRGCGRRWIDHYRQRTQPCRAEHFEILF
jgi:hypothetical protein